MCWSKGEGHIEGVWLQGNHTLINIDKNNLGNI